MYNSSNRVVITALKKSKIFKFFIFQYIVIHRREFNVCRKVRCSSRQPAERGGKRLAQGGCAARPLPAHITPQPPTDPQISPQEATTKLASMHSPFNSNIYI